MTTWTTSTNTATGTTSVLRNDYDPTRPPIELGTYAMAGPSSGAHEPAADPLTEVIPVVPQAAPRLDVPAAEPRRAARRPGLLRPLVNAASLGVLLVCTFVAGQWSVQNGVRPALPLPVSQVQSAAQTTRLWALASPVERSQLCDLLARPGDTRRYALAATRAHLQNPAGGRLQDVDPAAVARVLDNECAGRRP